MRKNHFLKLFIILLLASIALSSCSSQSNLLTNSPRATPILSMRLQPTQTLADSPTKSVENSNVSRRSAATEVPVRRDAKVYHTVLMLQKSADLSMTLIKRMHAGEIAPGDMDAIADYNYAFILAVESFNNANPPADYTDVWKQMYQVIQQYNTIYTWLIEGKTISKENLALLEESRQVLSLDQQMIEKFLKPGGLGDDFFTNEQKAVDQHFADAYGAQGQQVPEILP